MRSALERVMTCLALLFLGAGLAVVVLDGMDRTALQQQVQIKIVRAQP